jgi:hypothetical protein
LADISPLLRVLSLEGLSLLTDAGVHRIAERTKSLQVFNVNRCPQVSQDSLLAVLRRNRAITTFHVSCTRVNDDGLTLFSTAFSPNALTSLDVSFCPEIADFGLVSLAETCANLKYLNLCGLSRVTDKGVAAVCHKLWNLTYLNMEDIFLASDEAFWYNVSGGKVAGMDLM